MEARVVSNTGAYPIGKHGNDEMTQKNRSGKTNAVRMLDKHDINYELRFYEVDEHDLSADHVARAINLPPSQVFKTLVVHGNRSGILLACIPSDAELDVKALARISGNKRADLVPVKEINALTGYVRGGVSPVGTKKRFPVYIDSSAFRFDVISVSAGIRGCQMLVNPDDLSRILNGERAEIKKTRNVEE